MKPTGQSSRFSPIRALLPALALGAVLTSASTARADFSYFPYGWIEGDVANKLINQSAAPLVSGAGIELRASDPKSGYHYVQSSTLDINAGIYGGWFYSGGSFVDSLFGVGAAIYPVVGSSVTSTRYAADEASAQALPTLLVPAHAEALASWHPHDSINYDVRGGVIFSAGAGWAMTGLSGDYFARGDWTTYVEKLDGQKVYVKLTNVTLSDFDLVAGNIIASAMLSDFSKADDMFSYIFDLSSPLGAQAYEAMIHGSMKEAQQLSNVHPEVAQLDLSETGHTYGHQSRLFLGIPFLNASDTSGELYNYSDTLHHQDKSRSDVQYGLYWSEDDSVFFSNHSSTSKAFYGIAYTNTAAPIDSSSDSVKTSGQTSGKYGKLILAYENDHSDGGWVQDRLSEMVRQTGFRQQLQLKSVPSGDLKYTDLGLTVIISEAATRKLIAANAAGQITEDAVEPIIDDYFDNQGDPDRFCNTSAPDTCQDSVTDDTLDAVNSMKDALARMDAADKAHDDKAFVSAYGDFGEAMLKNEMVFGYALRLIGDSEVDVVFQAQGTMISQLTQAIQGTAPAGLPMLR